MQTATRTHVIRILNCSRQRLPIQISPPNGDFFLHEQQVHLPANKSVELPKDHVRMEQINNLVARKMIRVTYDSEANA